MSDDPQIKAKPSPRASRKEVRDQRCHPVQARTHQPRLTKVARSLRGESEGDRTSAVLSDEQKVRKPRAELQPLQVLQLPDALLTVRTVCAVSSLSESSIRRGVAVGTFPAPVKRGKRCTRWVSRDVTAWLRAQRGEA